MNLADMDLAIFESLRAAGLDVFDATFHPAAGGPAVACIVARDTEELVDDFEVQRQSSGAVVSYLTSQVGIPKLGDWFEFDGRRYTIEFKEQSQDSSLRAARCKVEVIA